MLQIKYFSAGTIMNAGEDNGMTIAEAGKIY